MREGDYSLHVRKAQLEDITRVFALSNDPIVRSVSFQDKPIEWREHVTWYTRIIADPRLVFLLGFVDQAGESDEGFVGQVRFWKLSEDQAEISISVSEPFRKRGMGRKLMDRAISSLKSESTVKYIIARVKRSNVASCSFFCSCGYREITESHLEGAAEDTVVFEKAL